MSININIEDYTMDELFSLLSINVDSKSDYTTITKQITDSADTYISTFEKLNKRDIVNFFKEVKTSLLGVTQNQTIQEQNILTYSNTYNPNKPYVTSIDTTSMFNSNNGAGNPIHRKTVSKLLNIDSRFRENYFITSSSDYMIDLPYPIHNVTELTLSDLEIPSTYYAINTANQSNYFWLNCSDSSDNDYFLYIVVPDGNYYFDTLIGLINAIISKSGLPFSVIFNLSYKNLGGVGDGNGLTNIGVNLADISSNEQIEMTHLEINFEAPPLLNVTTSSIFMKSGTDHHTHTYDSIDANKINTYFLKSQINFQQRLGWMLGYRKPIYKDAVMDTLGQLFYTSESIMDLLGPQYLFLLVDDFNKNINSNFFTSSINGLLPSTIIARIAIKSPAFNIQSQNDFSVYSESRYYYGPVNINKLHIKIIDDFGRPLNLNNKDFSFTLRLTTVYSVT